MYVPEPIREIFGGPGRLFSGGVALVAAVFAVLAEGVLGVGIFIVVALALLLAEVWRDSSQLTQALATATHERDLARSAEQATGSELEVERESISELQARSAQLAEKIAWLRARLKEGETELAPLVYGLEGRIEVVQLVLRHRALSANIGAARWPIVRIVGDSEGAAMIVASGGEDCDSAREELVSLISLDSSEVQTSGKAMVEGQQISIVVSLNELPPHMATELESYGEAQAAGYALELAGLTVKAYDAVGDAGLRQLQQAMSTAMQSVRSALSANVEPEGGSEQ